MNWFKLINTNVSVIEQLQAKLDAGKNIFPFLISGTVEISDSD